MSTQSPAPTDRAATGHEPTKPAPPAERLSTLQIIASALAAMTTTALLATLGVAGTIVGAALASVVTVLANFVYVTSLRRTADKVAAAVPAKTRVRPEAAPSEPEERPGALRAAVDRFGRRRIGATIAVVFVLVLGAVTVVELTAGKPLTDVVRNQEGAGTSLFGSTGTLAPAVEEDGVPGPGDVPTTEPKTPATPEPTEAPSEAPAPQAPTEEETTTPQESPTSPAPVEEESPAPAEDVTPGAAPAPEATPDPTPTPEASTPQE